MTVFLVICKIQTGDILFRNLFLIKNGYDNIGIKNDVKLFIARAEIFDYSSTKGLRIANKKVIENRKMDKSSCLNGVLIIF